MSKICLTRGFAGNKSKKISRRNLATHAIISDREQAQEGTTDGCY
jgi:hypothetical protein